MIAILDAYKQGLLRPKYWLQNIIAGAITGIVALPLALAFAIASGASPEHGLYTAIIAGIAVGIFGGSLVQVAGPTGAFVVLLSQITANFGIEGLQIATFLAGCILIIMGVMKLGVILKFIPDPVIVGFTSGIGVIIFIGQCKDFFGLNAIPNLEHFYQKLFYIITHLTNLHITTTILSFFTLGILIYSHRFFKKIPAPMIAMVFATLLQFIFNFQGISTIGNSFGGLPSHLPHIHFSIISFDKILNLIGPAFAIATLGAIESLLSAVVADGMTGSRHNSNQELVGQGIANVLTPLFGGFAATGAIARTATNVRSGGNNPISAIVHSLILILIILLLAPVASFIPLYALAAILFVVSYNMADVSHFVYIIKHAPKNDVFILITTFLLTIFTDLIVSVSVGVVFSTLLFVQRMSQAVSIELETTEELKGRIPKSKHRKISSEMLVYSIQGPFFFGAAEKLENTLNEIDSDLKTIVFRFKYVPFMDITGLQIFYEVLARLKSRNVDIYICEANEKVAKKLEKIRILQFVKDHKVFNNISDIVSGIHNNGNHSA